MVFHILFLPEFRVERIRVRDQLGVVALLGDLAVFKHQNQVGIDDGRQPMGNHNSGSIGGNTAQCI